jgi:hypothetical protein
MTSKASYLPYAELFFDPSFAVSLLLSFNQMAAIDLVILQAG